MISAEHLYKKYGVRAVVSDVSFEVKPGETLGFIGPNGAGKSTTIKMLCGVLPVYSGKVTVCGFDISEHPREAKAMIGYLPENAPLPPDMTVLGFLKYVAAMRGLSAKRAEAAVGKAAERCALEHVLGEEIESLSKGYKRRVCLAQAILHDPPVLLMDEPTDGLDPNQKREIRNLIQLLRHDTAILISTHILEEIPSVCSRVLLLTGGRTVFNGPAEQFAALQNTLSGCSVSVAEDDLAAAADVMRTRFPGIARLSGSRFILPSGDGTLRRVREAFGQNGIRFQDAGGVEATLDDVFASLTTDRTRADEAPDRRESGTESAPAPASGLGRKEDDDD